LLQLDQQQKYTQKPKNLVPSTWTKKLESLQGKINWEKILKIGEGDLPNHYQPSTFQNIQNFQSIHYFFDQNNFNFKIILEVFIYHAIQAQIIWPIKIFHL
jgi:hypothetical protein